MGVVSHDPTRIAKLAQAFPRWEDHLAEVAQNGRSKVLRAIGVRSDNGRLYPIDALHWYGSTATLVDGLEIVGPTRFRDVRLHSLDVMKWWPVDVSTRNVSPTPRIEQWISANVPEKLGADDAWKYYEHKRNLHAHGSLSREAFRQIWGKLRPRRPGRPPR